jgi:CarboxypepD_reg-like domain
MKKILLLSIYSFLTCATALAQNNTLSGSVKDAATGKPLAGVSVFLNATSKGTVTRADGHFVLPGIPAGRYEVIISAIGYQTANIAISSHSLPPQLDVALHVKASELTAVVVEPYLKDGWKRYGKLFLDYFIGTTENANHTKLKNHEVLRFHYYLKSRLLNVTATDPLIIENKALGYNLEYRLESFEYDMSTQIITYSGYPLFKEMTADFASTRADWEQHRRYAYLGSMMHFMRTLYKGQLYSEGFIVEHEVQIPNLEKQRVKAIYKQNITNTDSTMPMDTLHHYWAVLREPDFFTAKTKSTDDLLTIHPDQTRTLFFTGDCTIIYGNGHLGIAYQQSIINLMEPVPIDIGENGAYYPPRILSKGNWAKTETIANLLPRDYEMYGPETPASLH